MGPLTAVIEHSDKPHGLAGSQSEARFQGVLNGLTHELELKRQRVGILWQDHFECLEMKSRWRCDLSFKWNRIASVCQSWENEFNAIRRQFIQGN